MTEIEANKNQSITSEKNTAIQKFLEREEKDLSVQYWKDFIVNDITGDQIQKIPPPDDRYVIPLEFIIIVNDTTKYVYD